MTEAYLDACSIIYLTEGALAWRSAVEARLRVLPVTAGLVTSRISRLECRSKPIRDRDAALLARYDQTFAAARLVEMSAPIIERALQRRLWSDPLRVTEVIHPSRGSGCQRRRDRDPPLAIGKGARQGRWLAPEMLGRAKGDPSKTPVGLASARAGGSVRESGYQKVLSSVGSCAGGIAASRTAWR